MVRSSQGQPRSAPPAFVRLAAHPLRWQLLSALADSDYRVRELVALLGEPQNLLSYHLRQLREEGLVSARRSSHDRRDSYYHLDLDRCAAALTGTGAALHPDLGQAIGHPDDPESQRQPRAAAVLFVCSGNSIRSPIAEALLRHHGGARVRIFSGGTRPKADLHPHAVRILDEEFGIDVSAQRPRHVETFTDHELDHVITLCDRAREACPDFTFRPHRAHWSISDPAETPHAGQPSYRSLRQVASDIDTRVRHLVPTLTRTNS